MNIDETMEHIDRIPNGRPVLICGCEKEAGDGDTPFTKSDDLKALAVAHREAVDRLERYRKGIMRANSCLGPFNEKPQAREMMGAATDILNELENL